MENEIVGFYKTLTTRKRSTQELGPVPFSQDVLDSVRLAMTMGTPSIPVVDRGPAYRNRYMSQMRCPDYQRLSVMGRGVKEPAKKLSVKRSSPIRNVYRWPASDSKPRRLGDVASMQVVGRCVAKGKGSGRNAKAQTDRQDCWSVIESFPFDSQMKSHSLPSASRRLQPLRLHEKVRACASVHFPIHRP